MLYLDANNLTTDYLMPFSIPFYILFQKKSERGIMYTNNWRSTQSILSPNHPINPDFRRYEREESYVGFLMMFEVHLGLHASFLGLPGRFLLRSPVIFSY